MRSIAQEQKHEVKIMNHSQTTSKVTGMKQLIGIISNQAMPCIAKPSSVILGGLKIALCFVLSTGIALCDSAYAEQCNDGIDNDGDGRIDALVELSPENGRLLNVGGTGDPSTVRAAVDAAIVEKKFPYDRPTRDAIVRSDRASWLNSGGGDTGVVDTETLSRVCTILGYRDYVSSTCHDGERSKRYPRGKCNYHSTSNNIHWRFRNNTFVAEGASPKYGKTYLSTITCMHKLPACRDGWDNDGDGLVDGADGGCASANDDSEVAHDPNCSTPEGTSEFEITQCSDGKDNDGDGLTDLNDPGCPNKEGNNEGAATTQCQDGIDNDGDGAKDYPEDFSCSSPTDNDETYPKSQCQDGIDNDGDGVIDMADPGCVTKQGNNEGAATTQCQDGIDNDGDGAQGYPADFSCSSPTDNDETNPKSQCQDGIDNDGDGVIDMADPGCVTKQGNNEGAATTQCRDGVDNDGDGAKDYPEDFSCSSPTDNDETNPKSQCQDGIDNDGDGVIDMADPGCVTKQGNNEGAATTQCRDGVDNDGDGAKDYPEDFSCSSPSDNDETNPKSQCQDGMDNDGDGLVDRMDPGCPTNQGNLEASATSQCQNGVDDDKDGLIDYPQDKGCSCPTDTDEYDAPAACSDGRDNDADGLIDYPSDPGCASSSDTDESNSVELRVTPIAECVTLNPDGSFTARFGYVNDSNVTSVIPVGIRNYFSPQGINQGQPEAFLPGLMVNVFTTTVPAGKEISWFVGNSRAFATAKSKQCESTITECIEIDNKASLALLDGLARAQKRNIVRLSQQVSKADRSRNAQQSVESWRRQADTLYLEQWRDIWSSFPQVATSCTGCSSTDISGEVTLLITRAQRMSRVARQAGSLLRQARSGRLSTSERELVSETARLYDQFVQATQSLPKVSSVCK
jgi:hypothetical protein